MLTIRCLLHLLYLLRQLRSVVGVDWWCYVEVLYTCPFFPQCNMLVQFFPLVFHSLWRLNSADVASPTAHQCLAVADAAHLCHAGIYQGSVAAAASACSATGSMGLLQAPHVCYSAARLLNIITEISLLCLPEKESLCCCIAASLAAGCHGMRRYMSAGALETLVHLLVARDAVMTSCRVVLSPQSSAPAW